ncbi:MAG: alpha/beta hydrolase [Dehalococcoidia bacterium]|nr:alpha/beta hydrolase [Dehalococcoidia bacterium]
MVTLLTAACAGGDGPRRGARPAQAAQLTPSATEVAATPQSQALRSIATPQTLPVTPVTRTYSVADPKFEPLPGARAMYGAYSGGSYKIEVPTRWNGDVVYFAHGFRGSSPSLTADPPPIRQYLIDRGYAWAASSYSQNGYEPGVGARDTFALRDVFAQKVGTPKRQYLYGQSMGGQVVTYSLERYPTAYDGALSECGVVAGREILDYFLSWGTLAAYFSNTDLLGVTSSANALGARIKDVVAPALGTAADPTTQGRAFADVIENLTGGPRPFFRQGFAAQYALNFLVLVDAAGNAGPSNAAADNTTTTYRIDDGYGVTTAQLNRDIARVAANPAYRDPKTYPEFGPETGKIARPLLTIHGTGDLFVPISQEQSYRALVDAAGSGNLLVQRAIRSAGHCTFTEQERERSFDDLVAWVTQGKKPAGDDLRGELSNVGLAFTQPLRPDDPAAAAPSP